MIWPNVKLVFCKEIMDTLRDRRTLFIMMVLPILLYPIMMIGLVMMTQLQVKKIAAAEGKIVVIGQEHAPELVESIMASAKAKAEKSESEPTKETDNTKKDEKKIELTQEQKDEQRFDRVLENSEFLDRKTFPADFEQKLLDRDISVVIEIPVDFAQRLQNGSVEDLQDLTVKIWFNPLQDKSKLLKDALLFKVHTFKRNIFKSKLDDASIPVAFLEKAVELKGVSHEKALLKGESGVLLARMLAFMLVTLSLTGAFYPAIDMSAGEKERGTMETLLISPAARIELVVGKFITIFLISMVSAILNLLSMGLTAYFVQSMMPASQAAFAVPVSIVVYMLIVMVPLVALFSALSLAISTFARSFKEGQNYLNPLMVVTFLASMVTMLPGLELSIGMCFIPVVSVALLFRDLFAYDFQWTHVILSISSTFIYAVIALQWAVSLFEREEVLFRESEEINFKFWLKRGLKRPSASVFEAMFVYCLVIVLFFFASGKIPKEHLFAGQFSVHILIIFGLPVLMTYLLNLDWRSTLHLRLPSIMTVLRSLPFILLSILAIRTLMFIFMDSSSGFGDDSEQAKALEAIFAEAPTWLLFLLIAVTPAISEEIICRGFLLSSFKRGMGATRAIFVTAVLFGLMHMNVDQLPNAVIMGVALAAIVVRTGSIVPAMIFHLLSNGSLILGEKYFNSDAPLPVRIFLPGEEFLKQLTDKTIDPSTLWIVCVVSFALAIASYFLIPKTSTD